MTADLTLYGGALWLGLLTAVSPCPLATNLAATAYLARRVESRKRAIAGTLAYTLGRIGAYAAIAGLLALGFTSAPAVSQGLQRWMTPLLGPLLILTAMLLLGLLSLPIRLSVSSQASAEKWASRGLAGECMLGFMFALSFCPVSAALFFGSLIPLTLDSGNIVVWHRHRRAGGIVRAGDDLQHPRGIGHGGRHHPRPAVDFENHRRTPAHRRTLPHRAGHPRYPSLMPHSVFIAKKLTYQLQQTTKGK
jgi:cytochrome c biogenesis protein CcdA